MAGPRPTRANRRPNRPRGNVVPTLRSGGGDRSPRAQTRRVGPSQRSAPAGPRPNRASSALTPKSGALLYRKRSDQSVRMTRPGVPTETRISSLRLPSRSARRNASSFGPA